MANPILDFNLGAFIQIYYSKGIRDQISMDFREFEMIQRLKDGNPDGREMNFMFKLGRGPASTQYAAITDYGFAKGQQSSVAEYTAEYQQILSTVEFDYNLWNQAKKNPNVYGDFLAEELKDKVLNQKRQLCKDFYGDGTGVLGETSAAADKTDILTGKAVITLKTDSTAGGHVGFFEYDDLVVAADEDGTLRTPSTDGTFSSTFYAWRVDSLDRAANTVTLVAVNSDYQTITVSGGTVAGSDSGIAADDFIYRVGLDASAARVDRTSISDYGKQLVIPGLESLAASDGRIVHGIAMTGRTGATEVDGGAATLGLDSIETALNNVKVRCGENAYSYKIMSAAPETHSFLINERDDRRRFNTVDDTKRGGRVFGYQHRSDFLEMASTEFVPKNRIWMLPEAKTGDKVLCSKMTDFETDKVNDTTEFRWAVEGGQRVKKIQTSMTARGTLVCKHPASIAVIKNFALS